MTNLLTATNSTLSTVSMFLPFIMILVVSYFMLIRPQKKRELAMKEMRSKIEVGDEVITQGGIIGRVVSYKDETIVIETGTDRSKIRIARWAIATNTTATAAAAQSTGTKETSEK